MKLRSYLFVFLLGLFAVSVLSSCEEGEPDGIMAEEEMVPVLMDLHLAYAGVDASVRNPRKRPAKYKEMNELIIKKHALDREQFYKSYEYYQSQPPLMDSLYQKVIDGLNTDLQGGTGAGAGNPNP